MRRLLLTALCTSVSCYGIDNAVDKIINPFTRNIYYRYYLIQRCEEPVQIFKDHPKIWDTIDFVHLDVDCIENATVKEKAQKLQSLHLIEPFLALWHQMTTHRHLDDESFHKDFIKLLFMLYKSLEQPAQKHNAADTSTSITTMLNSIDKYVERMQLNPHKNSHEYASLESNLVTTDDIALNYYLIQRLDKSIKLLSAIHNEFSSSSSLHQVMCNVGINFSHERINTCINQVALRKNLEPILHTWKEFSHFRHAGDAHFLKEMLMMLFAVYKDLLFFKLNEVNEEVITAEMNTILDLYEHIDELPLDEILQAIDITTDKLLLLQGMERKGKQTWSQQYPILFHTMLALPIAYFIIKTCAL